MFFEIKTKDMENRCRRGMVFRGIFTRKYRQIWGIIEDYELFLEKAIVDTIMDTLN